MPRRRWIKLWTQETLYGTTSQELELDEQAIWFKLLALAGDSPEPGKVEVAPGIPLTDEQIAGILKAPLDVWFRAKQRLQDVDKIYINEGVIKIKNWDKYQSEYERTKKYRDTEKSTENATSRINVENSVEKVSSLPDQSRPEEEDNTTTATGDELARASKLYEDNIGRLTSFVAERLKDLTSRYPPGWFEEALKEAVKLEHRHLKYIEAILERWQREGFKSGHRPDSKEPPRPPRKHKGREPEGLPTTQELKEGWKR